jgi:integrase
MWAELMADGCGLVRMAGGKLSPFKIRNLTTPGRYGDGDGLWLQVRDARHRSWLFRYTTGGKQRQMGLGPFPDVSLAEAREAAREARAAVRKGIDPIDIRRVSKAAARAAADAMTFQQVADLYLAAHEAAWRNAKHRWQWKQTLNLACERIGKIPVAAIATGDVLRVLEPIWHTKTETAKRLRGRIESVIDYATARSWRSGENPARWRGHLAKLLPPPRRIAKVQHHEALPWQRIGAFMAELRAEEGIAARALEFTILTAARSGETVGARWSEIDMQAAVWSVPAERMKGSREHRVPLSAAAMRVLEAVAPLRNDNWVFAGNAGKPLSDKAMIMVLRRMERLDLTVHGFRSAFRDWCAEATNHPREIAEKALAHALREETERAYQRGDLLEKRRWLMDEWATFCALPTLPAEVLPIRA